MSIPEPVDIRLVGGDSITPKVEKSVASARFTGYVNT
jgi:hypothetical protein